MGEQAVGDVLAEVHNNVAEIESLSDQVVCSYTSTLDHVMQRIYEELQRENLPVDLLEQYSLELSNILYFMGDSLENLGIYDDISKAMYKETYNRAYLSNQVKDTEKRNKTTVAENQAHADEQAKPQAAANAIYARAYKRVKYKIEAAQEMVNTLRKIITKRIQEMQLSMSSGRTMMFGEGELYGSREQGPFDGPSGNQ